MPQVPKNPGMYSRGQKNAPLVVIPTHIIAEK